MFTPCSNLREFNSSQIDNHFISLLDQLALRHSYYNAFEAFLDCAINGLSMNYSPYTMEAIRKTYSQDERYMFGEMIRCWIYSCNINVPDDNSFHDFLGKMYERNAMTKQKGFAQYFTPEDICRFMVQILAPYENAEAIAEPACGSGRFNLAAHACNHRLIHHANDLDYTCAKMTALNFFIHGVKGVVTSDDTLVPGSSFKGAFTVNFGDYPNIEFIEDRRLAYHYLYLVMPRRKDKDEPAVPVTDAQSEDLPDTDAKIITPSQIGQQLSLF
ncbi:SAM-dependent methyltransferase [Sphingobacterium hotanense]|uniref:SAM-dependent methyltransferase n=1 Tax=Sphingobacterium hotanense TaxID=649196 RepID=UPI0021A8304B|nr:SAM-dependent methyltransferase [Sphingobacterium hotanense]MCT1526090.1 SAM-dependent methyltransferase [Sphingobacterium hotanense]